MLLEVLDGDQAAVNTWGDNFLAIFLAGGTLGGLVFGSLADRLGRRPIMIATILMYSVFSGLTYFANDIYVIGVLRFLVALGIGGEWAVAASLVAEVFPKRARAQAAGIFHASSILGTWLAALSGILVATNWRYAYLLGVLPALLIVWVRASVKEPQRWKATRESEIGKKSGSFADLLLNPKWNGLAIRGMLLAAVGLGTFWSVTVAGQDLVRELLLSLGVTPEVAGRKSKFAYGIVQAAGGGLGLLAFGPLCARFGRKPTFIGYHVLALLIVPVVCFLPQTYAQMLVILPVFGFFTLGLHSGYAIYFPELFPTHIRATGASFCFNGGRLLAVPVLLFSGWLKGREHVSLPYAVWGLSALFLVGIAIMLTLPETKQRDLVED
jgi:MFS family permease